MEKLSTEEQKTLVCFDPRIGEIKHWKETRLKEEIESQMKELGYFGDKDWRAHYSVEAIFKALQIKIWQSGLDEEQIKYVSSWSWAAFLGGFIFTFGSKLYLKSLLLLIPFYNIYYAFHLGKNGRRLSYQKGWLSFNEFKKRQNLLGWIIGSLLVLVIAIKSLL